MGDERYTIKDIARMAGVSAGTVDRVLHNRGDVSPKSKEKVQKVLDEIDYEPNVFAIGLAAKKHYTFVCVIPCCKPDDYWHSVFLGIERARKELRSFNIDIQYRHFEHGNPKSYKDACALASSDDVDALLVAPNFRDTTLNMIRVLHERNIPYVFIDFNIENTRALEYIGQDSDLSGYMAAKILMRSYTAGDELVLFLSDTKESPSEIQMHRRINGFMRYLHEKFPAVAVHEVVLNKHDEEENRIILNSFFRIQPNVAFGAVFNSRIYMVGNYLRNNNVQMKGLIGYDLLPNNVELMKQSYVTCLIGQRPGLQGYCGVKTLCDHVVFKKQVESIRYMPIDILIKENIDFYFEFV